MKQTKASTAKVSTIKSTTFQQQLKGFINDNIIYLMKNQINIFLYFQIHTKYLFWPKFNLIHLKSAQL